jgi:hypothetical protein
MAGHRFDGKTGADMRLEARTEATGLRLGLLQAIRSTRFHAINGDHHD